MSKKIKLIWDFRGIDPLQTAEHHCRHLKEFAIKEKIEPFSCDTQQITQHHCCAFIVVDETLLNLLKQALKPHRGEIVP